MLSIFPVHRELSACLKRSPLHRRAARQVPHSFTLAFYSSWLIYLRDPMVTTLRLMTMQVSFVLVESWPNSRQDELILLEHTANPSKNISKYADARLLECFAMYLSFSLHLRNHHGLVGDNTYQSPQMDELQDDNEQGKYCLTLYKFPAQLHLQRMRCCF